MPQLTRSQFFTKHAQLTRKVSVVNFTEHTPKSLISAAKSTLDFFKPEASPTGESSSTLVLPEGKDVADFIKMLVPAPTEIFSNGFYYAPLFPVVVLHEIAQLYDFASVPESFLNQVNLTDTEKGDSTTMVLVWIVEFLGCGPEMARSVIDKYRSSRGSSNVLLHQPQGSSSNGPQNTPANGRDRNNPPQGTPPSQTPQDSDRQGSVHVQFGEDPRKANYVQQMFNNRKFTGDLTQSIQTTLKLYGICARQYFLTAQQKADLFVHVFDGAAQTFFFNNVSEEMSYEDMATLMLQEYNSDARQLQVKGRLETLRLRNYMQENEISDVSDGLSKLVQYIDDLTPQCHPAFRSDTNKIDFLRKAVVEFEDWSRLPIQNITSRQFTFNGFVTALHEAIQNLKELQLLTGKHIGGLQVTTNQTAHVDSQETFMQHYGRNPKFVRKTGRHNDQQSVNRYGRTFEESRRRNECHKCGSPWRPGHRCNKGGIRKHVRERLSKGESSVNIVSDLVSELEEDLEDCQSGQEEDPSHDAEESEAHHASSPSELQLFNSLQEGTKPVDTSFVEAADKEWFINNLSASIQGQVEPGRKSTVPDFH